MGRSKIGKIITKLMPKNASEEDIKLEKAAIEEFIAEHYNVM